MVCKVMMTLMFRVVMVAPTTMASLYLGQAWRGNGFCIDGSRMSLLICWQLAVGIDRDKLLAFENLLSVGLFVIGDLGFTRI